MKKFNMIGIYILGVIITVYALAIPVVILSLWNEPFAREWFQFLEISPVFPAKVSAGFTAVAGWAILVLAFLALLTIKSSSDQQQSSRYESLLREKRERDERMLDEIVNWATDIFSCSVGNDIRIVSLGGIELVNAMYFIVSTAINKSLFIKEITPAFGNDLLLPIERAITELETLKNILTKQQAALLNNPGKITNGRLLQRTDVLASLNTTSEIITAINKSLFKNEITPAFGKNLEVPVEQAITELETLKGILAKHQAALLNKSGIITDAMLLERADVLASLKITASEIIAEAVDVKVNLLNH